MVETAAFNNPFGKPVLVTEFGGSAMAADLGHLRREVHAALWASTSSAVAGTPLFWWWQVIEEENFYPMYRAVANFMEGEDRRDPALLARPIRLTNKEGGHIRPELLAGVLLASPEKAYGWVHLGPLQFATQNPESGSKQKNYWLNFEGTEGAIYRFEFWDTVQGTVVTRLDERVRGGRARIEIPPFARDIAFKVKRQQPPNETP